MKSIGLQNLKLSSISGQCSDEIRFETGTARGQKTRKRLKTALIELFQERAHQVIRLEGGRRPKEADPLAMIYQNY